ncbi:MAG: tetratricopeptide repeat protein [Bacteroidales bacterium]|nr:tetratricopeptide repeat protein [Bacteroidales bacterium]
MIKFRAVLYILFISIFLVLNTYSQESGYIDSLKVELTKKKNAEDSVNILCRIAWAAAGFDSVQTLQYGLQALKIAEKIQNQERISEAYDAAAWGYRVNSEFEKAKFLYEQSLKIGREHALPERIAWGCYNLSQLAINSGRFEEAKVLAEESRKNFKSLNNYYMVINCNTVKLKADKISGFSEATIDTFISDINGSFTHVQDSAYLINAYLSLANLYSQRENKSQSLHYIQLAMELAELSNNKKGIVKTYNEIGNYFRDELKNYEVALVYYNKILKIYENNAWELNTADMYNQIGSVYQLMLQDSLALEYFQKSLEIGTRLNHRHTKADSYKNIGKICYLNNQYDDALSYFLKSYETGCDICPNIKFHSVLIDVGNVYLQIKDFSNAYRYYQKSLVLADSSGSSIERAISLQHIGNYFKVSGRINQAIKNYSKAMELSYATNTLHLQRDISKELSKIYFEMGNYKNAFELLKVSNTLKDSLDIISKADNMARLETKFEFQNLQLQKELEIKENKIIADEEINKQAQQKFFFIIGFVLMTLLGIVIFTGYRRKKKDNRLLELQKKQIEKMSDEVHQADQAKLQFFTNISHEFKTPLTIIMGMTEKIKSLVHDDQYLKIIRKNSLKLLQLVNHLLDLRKIDSSKMKLSVKEGNINEFIKGIISSFENIAQQKSINIDFHAETGQVTGFFDHDKMEKIVGNLISNALKYTNHNGLVKISTKETANRYIEIDVSDNGIGISENELKNIFNRFYRVSENNNQGSGIGLALVKELVELHKGAIKVHCEKGVGSSFIVSVPVDKQFYSEGEFTNEENETSSWNYAEILDIEDEKTKVQHLNTPDPNRKTILIVEDNHDLRKYVAGMFIDEYEVIEAPNGKDGYKMAREYVPDIIISDIMMPAMSGIQLVDKIKNDVTTSHIPIILLTAKNDIGTRLNSFEKGADDYISKPFDSAILKSRVENLLRLRKQLVEKFSKQFQLQPREISIENADQKFLQEAIFIIEKHISNPNLNVELLAMELGVSRTQLYRKLNALTDYPAKHFIRIIRLKRAAQILKQGQNNIAEVMDATGFSNYSFFNNCFKEYFGKYPKEYSIVSVKGNLN